MYRPQYLEQWYEETYIYAGSDSKPYLTIRKPIKSDTYKRKESNEIIPFRRRRKVKWETTGMYPCLTDIHNPIQMIRSE